MWELIKRNPLAAFLAVLMHLLLLGFMIVGVDWLKRPHPMRPAGDLVQAHVVDAQQVQAEADRLRQQEVQRQKAAEAAQRREKQRIEDLQRKQEAERQRLAALEKQRQAEAAKQALERKKAAAKAAEEAARLAKLKAEREALEEQHQKEEAQRKAEEKKHKAEEAKRLAEEQKRKADEQRRQQEEARKKAEAERVAAAQRAREDALRRDLAAEEGDQEVDHYAGLIRDKIERSWLRPLGVPQHLQAVLRVNMVPGGGVIAVRVIQSSGNGAFDRSAEAAVRKADPLPVPSGALPDRLREFDILFDPDKS